MMSKIFRNKSDGCFKYISKEARIKCAESNINVGEKFFIAAYISSLAVWVTDGLSLLIFAPLIVFSTIGILLRIGGLRCLDKIHT